MSSDLGAQIEGLSLRNMYHLLCINPSTLHPQGAVIEASRQVEGQIRGEVGQGSMPLAKVIPKVTAAGNALLDVQVGFKNMIHSGRSYRKGLVLTSDPGSPGPGN